jgi:hypothetical protein
MKSLNTIVSTSINRGITPGIRKETISAAREIGGLGVINPKVQQLSLYYRWLKPMLFQDPLQLTNLLTILRAHIQNRFKTSEINITLFFPASRKDSSGTRIDTMAMILKTMDSIPKKPISDTIANPLECLNLPLPAILPPPVKHGFKLAQRLTGVKVSDIFDYHPEGHYLNWKPFFELEQPLRIGARALTTALFVNATHLHHFFEKCLHHTQLSWLNPDDRNTIRSQQLQFKSFKSQLVLSAKSNSSKAFRQAFTQAH